MGDDVFNQRIGASATREIGHDRQHTARYGLPSNLAPVAAPRRRLLEDIPGATGSFLTVEDTNLAMSGAVFRARLRNGIDTTYSRRCR